MSHRVWEGVRRDEYQFSELPEMVKQKEAQQVYGMLSGAKQMPEELNNIPVGDRNDFTRAWGSGRKNEAYIVLDRSSFKENVARSTAPVLERNGVAHQASSRRDLADNEQVNEVEVRSPPRNSERNGGKAFSTDLLAGLDNSASKPTDLPTPIGNVERGPQ